VKFRRQFSGSRPAGPGAPPRPARLGRGWFSQLTPPQRRAVIAGGALAGSVLLGYLAAALVLFPAPVFVREAEVPRVIGLSLDSARAELERRDLRANAAERTPHPRAPAGQVVWQDPPPGVVATSGTTVELSLSAGPQRVPVPDVAGYEGSLARTLIEAAGLTAVVESLQTAAPKGVTVNTRPPAGTVIGPGGRVTLVVSRGAPTISVPRLAGFTLSEATLILEQTGLRLGTTLSRAAPEPPGTVIDQRPASGTLAAPGTAVDLILARPGAL
jgi:serine/threonine-protein kinase